MPFADIVGHERIIDILRRALAARRTAHAYLFAGPEGCGKRATALAMVQAAFCGGRDACGSCPACRKVAAWQHPDLRLLEPDGAFIKIEQVRELQRELYLRPYEAPFKACIVEAAERFHTAAGNALLKTLEEPPGSALLILLSANPDGVLPTIRSRCQAVQFAPVPEAALARFLAGRGVEPGAAALASSLAGGSPGRALELCAGEALAGRRGLLEEVLALSPGEIAPLFAAAERLAADKEGVLGLLDLLTAFFRDVMHLQHGTREIANLDLEDLVRREAGRRSRDQVVAAIDYLLAQRRAMARNVNARLMLDVLFMRLAA
jgi:DNA polymerase-3 subunit delta'